MLKGTLNISRGRDKNNKNYVHLELIDKRSRTHFLQVYIGMEEMMAALTNLVEQPCEFTLLPELVGKKCEHKTELIFCRPWGMSDEEKLELLRPYEIDGWVGRKEDLKNYHNCSDKGIRVTFVRHIDENSSSE